MSFVSKKDIKTGFVPNPLYNIHVLRDTVVIVVEDLELIQGMIGF